MTDREKIARLIAELNAAAEQSANIQREMAQEKSLRQPGNSEGRKDLYMSPTPDQTLQGRASAAITAAYNKGRADRDWQDIATAPKDGKCVVWCATDDGGEMRILDRTSKGDWLYEGQETFCHGFYIEPTHWRPLPDPPAAIRAIPVGEE